MNNRLIKFFNITGLTWFVPFVKIASGENPAQQARQLFLIMGSAHYRLYAVSGSLECFRCQSQHQSGRHTRPCCGLA